MHYVVKRLGFQPPRGLVPLFFILCLLLAGVFWMGPFQARPAELRLLGLSGDGRFNEYVGIPTAWAKLLPPASEATARLPLILAVHNGGARAARPNEIALSMPARFRVTDVHGVPLPVQRVIGNPLVRYELPIRTPAIEPGHLPTIIAGLDTLWLEPVVPTMYCTALSDSVPEFVSAPAQNPQVLSSVRIFYSFAGPDIRSRQTGVLTIQVDPELVRRQPPPAPPVFETRVTEPAAPRPAMSGLTLIGSRATWCGDPGQPMEIFDVLWETEEGGRFFVLYNGGVPRKYLFDLNRDSIIELEMWDQDANGSFESRRAARMAIPAFLMPYPAPPADAADHAATVTTDTVQTTPDWLQLFYNTEAGPLRFSGQRAAAPAAPAQPAATPATSAPGKTDSAFLRLFNNSGAGPLRFQRALSGDTPAPPPPVVESTRPKLLGVPVEEYRRQQESRRNRRDTSRSEVQRR